MLQADKPQIRSTLRTRRRKLPDRERLAAGFAITSHILSLPHWQQVQHCALYIDSDGEVPTEPLAQELRSADKILWLPVVQADKTLAFARWDEDSPLVANRYGIPEPGPQQPRQDIEKMDWIFMPLVAWDRSGTRLGMGGGYYDRSLPDERRGPIRIGIGYSFQEISELPREPWDRAMDFVLTEIGPVRSN